jgi:hypothetical protein
MGIAIINVPEGISISGGIIMIVSGKTDMVTINHIMHLTVNTDVSCTM